jgi:hypothetical protein
MNWEGRWPPSGNPEMERKTRKKLLGDETIFFEQRQEDSRF